MPDDEPLRFNLPPDRQSGIAIEFALRAYAALRVNRRIITTLGREILISVDEDEAKVRGFIEELVRSAAEDEATIYQALLADLASAGAMNPQMEEQVETALRRRPSASPGEGPAPDPPAPPAAG